MKYIVSRIDTQLAYHMHVTLSGNLGVFKVKEDTVTSQEEQTGENAGYNFKCNLNPIFIYP